MKLFNPPATPAAGPQGLSAAAQAYQLYLQDPVALHAKIEDQAEQRRQRDGRKIRMQIQKQQGREQAIAMGAPSNLMRGGLRVPHPPGGIGR